MKHYLPLAAIALLTSCYSPVEEQEVITQSKEVQFVMKGLDTEYSRATITSEGMTDLWVIEGTTLLDHQVSTDADFGAPTISLTYGSHDITFIASKSTGQTFSTNWKCTKVADTYGKAMNVTVSKGSSSSRQVELSRVNAKVQWTIEDAIPQTASTLEVSIPSHLGLDASLNGTSSTTFSTSMNITSLRGQSNKQIAANILPETYGTESSIDATITIKDESGTVICTYTNTVGILTNRVTNIHGSFFAGSGSNEVTLNNAWSSTSNVDL